MADKFISANAIYDELSDIFIEYLATTSNTDIRNALDSLYHTVLSAVDAAPSATDTNVVGKWISKTMTVPGGHGQTYNRWGCSKCKARFKTRTKYCSNCGARMEMGEDA